MSAVQIAKQIANMISDSRIFSLGYPSRKKYEEALSKSKNLRDREMMAIERGFDTQYTRKDLPTPRIRNADEDVGSVMVGIPSDRSDVGRIEMAEGLLVPEGRNVQGGQGFAREHSEWASGQGIAERFQRKIDKIAEITGLPVQAVVNVMSKRAIDFSDPPALIMAQMAREIPMTKTIKESLNKAVREKFPDFAGFDTEEGIAQLAGDAPVSTYGKNNVIKEGSAGELRKWFINRSELAPYRDAGMPSFNQINEIITDPELKDLNYGDAGSTIWTPDTNTPVVSSGGKHTTYSHIFGQGSDVSGYEIPIPFELNAPEANRILSQELSVAGQPLTRNQKIDAFNKRGADNVGSYEIATQKRADDINAYIDFVKRGKPLPKALKATLVSAGILTAAQAEAGVFGKSIDFVEDAIRSGRNLLYHSGDASLADDMQKYGIEPRHGEWVTEVLEGSVDDPDVMSYLEGVPEASWYSNTPEWVKSKVARKLGKNTNDVTITDIEKHGHLAIVDPEGDFVSPSDFYRIPEEGMDGPQTVVTNLLGEETKIYNTPLYNFDDYGGGEKVTFGLEPNDIVTTESVDPLTQLTGDDLLQFLRRNYPNTLEGVSSPAVVGLLATEAATPEGQLNPLLAVPAEIGSALNEAVVGTVDFLVPDTVNAVSELIGSEYRMPRLSDQELVRLYTQGGYMDEGYGRDAIRTATGLLSPL